MLMSHEMSTLRVCIFYVCLLCIGSANKSKMNGLDHLIGISEKDMLEHCLSLFVDIEQHQYPLQGDSELVAARKPATSREILL